MINPLPISNFEGLFAEKFVEWPDGDSDADLEGLLNKFAEFGGFGAIKAIASDWIEWSFSLM